MILIPEAATAFIGRWRRREREPGILMWVVMIKKNLARNFFVFFLFRFAFAPSHPFFNTRQRRLFSARSSSWRWMENTNSESLMMFWCLLNFFSSFESLAFHYTPRDSTAFSLSWREPNRSRRLLSRRILQFHTFYCRPVIEWEEDISKDLLTLCCF